MGIRFDISLQDAKQIHEVQQAATFDELPVLEKLTFKERMEVLGQMKAEDFNPGEYIYTQVCEEHRSCHNNSRLMSHLIQSIGFCF